MPDWPVHLRIMKRALLIFALVLSTAGAKAHDVLWWDNLGFPPFLPPPPMVIEVYPEDLLFDEEPFATIKIYPESFWTPVGPFFEPCTVFVNMDPPKNPLLGVDVAPNPAIEVDVDVFLKDLPPANQVIDTEVTGEWHATGLPEGFGCDAVMPNKFTVPVQIIFNPPKWFITYDETSERVNIDTHRPVTIQGGIDLKNWMNIGVGQTFSVAPEGQLYFFREIKLMGGNLLGTITDPAGKPQTGITADLSEGGRNTKPDDKGNYVMNFMPFGDNLIQIIKTFLITDPVTGEKGTNLATFDLVVPIIKAYGTLNLKVEMQTFQIPLCNCTPWCSIGFGAYDGTTTPIYFSGGANPPKAGPASCGAVEVTVTRPDGSILPLKAGKGRHQNSGANPMPGTWKVTTKVCGQEKTCTIDYP
jgi:hypothetical protein